MDKGKSKTDLRAAGKKRLEEYRQKRQQKGSSTKPSSTTALKALTESGHSVGENAVEEIARRASPLKAEKTVSQKDGEVESVVDHVHGDALEERHEVDVVFDMSPGSSVTSSIQRLEVGGNHLTPGTSEQSAESLREPGSSNGNLDDEDREAVYTILWENHGTEDSQCNEEWQESTFDGGVSLNERRLHQGNCSSYWVDNESYKSEIKGGLSTQRKLSGNSIGAADKFQSSEDSEVKPTLSNLFSESELVERIQSVQGMLQTRDLELTDAIKKLEGANRVISEQEEEAKAYVQRNERLKEELMKCREDLGMFKSNVDMAEQKMIGLKNELHEVIESFNSIPEERDSQPECVTLSMNEVVTEVSFLAKAIVKQAHRREMELQSANETAVATLLLESNSSKELLTKFEREYRDSRNAAQDITWLYGGSPPQSSLLDWATWLIDTLQNEHRKFEQCLQVTESMTVTANQNTLEVQHLQAKIDSLYVELTNQQTEKEAVVEDLQKRDLELQSLRNKLEEQVENNLVLESEVESARSLCRVESALTGIESIVGDLRFRERPPPASTPSEWISWLVGIFREVSEELKTSESTSGVLSLEVEEAKEKYSSLYEELLSQKHENENLHSKHRAVHEVFGAERDSLQAEIQVLKDSSAETSSRELELSEALKVVTNLQEALIFKDRELSELQGEVDDLSLRSAQQNSDIQSLRAERERLSSEEAQAQRLLQERIDSLYVELTNQQTEKEAVVEDLQKRDLELQSLRNKLEEQVENNLVLESEVESARSLCRVESALTGIESIVGDLRFRERPPPASTPSEWISWLVGIFREVSEELKTSESTSGVLSLEVEEAKEKYSSLYEELLSQKHENENLHSKHRAVHEVFGAERDSLQAEIQVLKDSSAETSSRELELSEALKVVTNLQEALIFKDRELSELQGEVDDLSLRSAQQNSDIQSLRAERERLSSEEAQAQRLLQERIDSLYVELTNQQTEKEAVVEDLQKRDLELQSLRNKLEEQVENNLVLESEVESARSLCRVESALTGIESIVGDLRFRERPPPASTPSEWISWLVGIFREVSEELKTSESTSGVLSLEVEEAKEKYSSLYEELLSQKHENENLHSKHRAVHEVFGAERDSLQAEIQVLKDSSAETSSRELELSEALKVVTNLQEALIFKDRELSELQGEVDDLSLRSAQQNSDIQSLRAERERLSSEEAQAQRLLQERIDSLYVELTNQQTEKEAVVEDLQKRDLELQSLRNKLEEQVENNLVLESEVESARSLCRVESALTGIESIVGDLRFRERPPPASTPSEWISWLVGIFREVSEELKTSESTSGVLSLEVEEAKEKYSSLYEELLSQKHENENLHSKHRAVHEVFGAERDSLQAEIQVLKDSSAETSSRELELSEALKVVTNLQEALIFKDRELSELQGEVDDLSLRSAQQNSDIQSLRAERERLSSEEAQAQRLLQERIDSLYVELTNQQTEKEAVVEDLQKRDLELQSLRNKLEEQVENNLVLESEVESARSLCRVESALTGIESIVGDLRFRERPPPASTPSEWISWLVGIFREVSEELKTSESTSGVLSLEVEEAKEKYSSLYEELLSQKHENENLHSKHRAVHEVFGAERDSLQAEIQVLKDSSAETSSRELELSEALKVVTNLQEALIFKDRELSELQGEVDDLSLRSAQQNSDIQSLRAERERLSSEEAQAQRLLQERIDSLYVELTNQQTEKEAVVEDLQKRDLELQSLRNKLEEQVENNLVLESEVESARSLCRVESALTGIESIVGDLRFRERPPPASTPSEWISWLVGIFREVSEELKTSESTSGVLSLEVEEAKEKYSSLYEELLSQKHENENLHSKHRAVHEVFGAERDSLQAEIQVLKDSSAETSSRELELSEALKVVTNLQEALIFKDRELSELQGEVDDLSLRSAQQNSDIQSLMEERERLSSEVVNGKAQCSLLQAETAQTANERSNLQSNVSQLEQKLGAVREKLNIAINKGKALVKQRDSLKQLLVEETAKVETMVSSHAKDSQSKDLEVLEMRAQVESMATRVQELQAEVSSLSEKATAYQQRLEAEHRGLESVFFGIDISKDLLPRDPIEKVKWLVSLLEGARSTTKFLEGELDSSRNALETIKATLRDTEERLQSVTVENLRAQEDISMYVKKVEEVESRATSDGVQYKNEVDDLTGALKESDLRQQAAWSRVKEFEKIVEKQQNTINASEVAHSKAVTKLTFTRNKLNLLVQDSQELVRECENLHKSLQERDIEIAELNHEVDKLKNVIHNERSQHMDASSKTSLQLTLLQDELARANEKFAATVKDSREQLVALQCLLKEKYSVLEGVRTKVEDILLKSDNVLWMENDIVHQNIGDDGVADIDVQSMNGSLDFTSAFTTLEEKFNNLVAEVQKHRISSDKKEAQIQKLRKELHDISIERTTLQAGVQAKTVEVERLQSEVNSKDIPVERNISAESEIEELGTRSTWVGAGNPVTPHVRGPRRHSQADIAIDMVDASSSSVRSDVNDKERGFSALTNSRLVPKAARILTDRLDGLWFVGGRILTRQPSARLGLAMYWIFIHIYMAMIFSRGIL